ncbi:MAG TPA: hypothetical protein VK589_10430 [Chryseolinea sp.]|nr:hypothetical protein [Chryseolinea sp.]
MKEVSVNEALRIGKKNAGMRFVVPFYLTQILAGVASLAFSTSFYLIFISIPLGILLSYYFTTRYLYQWQIWAFQQVRNVHELKSKAEKWGLIPGWESKLFPPSGRDRLILESLREKFSEPDIVPDDSHVPDIVEIYYSKTYNRFELICWSMGFIATTWAIIGFVSENNLQGEVMMQVFLGGLWLVTLLFSIENFIQLRTTQPVITLTQDGIRIKRRLFTKADVKDIEIYDGKHRTLKVKFHVTKLSYPVEITDLDVNVNALEDIVEVFVRRWKA